MTTKLPQNTVQESPAELRQIPRSTVLQVSSPSVPPQVPPPPSLLPQVPPPPSLLPQVPSPPSLLPQVPPPPSLPPQTPPLSVPPQAPPPPPPLFSGSSSSSDSSSEPVCQGVYQQTLSKDLAHKAYSQLCEDDRIQNIQPQENVYLSVYKPCTPLIQNGPRCGLVALAMAAEILGEQVSCDHVFQQAKTLGFTKQGEMFSVTDMARLCEEVICCDVRIVHPMEDLKFIVKCVLQGWPVLIPYDADRNHQPCLKKGHTAHWVVLNGVFLKTTPMLLSMFHDNSGGVLSQSKSVNHLYIVESLPPTAQDFLNKDSTEMHSADIWVYGHQGKSRYPGIWKVQDLIDSNNNLTEINMEKFSQIEQWVLPENGLSAGLKNQAVLLLPKQSLS